MEVGNLNSLVKFVKKKCKGFTLMLVPNSYGGRVKSFAIPVSAALIVLGIILFLISIFFLAIPLNQTNLLLPAGY